MVCQSILPRSLAGEVSRLYTAQREGLTNSWAENTQHISAPTSSRRSPSPTETETDTTNDHGMQERPDSIKEQDEEVSETGRGLQSRKGSVYLDAVSDTDDQPSISDIMQELRDMPMPDAAAQEQEQVAIPELNPLNMQTASPVVNPLPPPIRKARTLRHSFSSSTIPSTATRSTLRVDEDVEATVELHEESAAAFQDFLFWAYPHLDCRVSWTNVEAVSTSPLVFVKGLMYSW
jgi:hypothetical protein